MLTTPSFDDQPLRAGDAGADRVVLELIGAVLLGYFGFAAPILGLWPY